MNAPIFRIERLVVTSAATRALPRAELLQAISQYFEKHWDHYLDSAHGMARRTKGRVPIHERFVTSTGSHFVIRGSADGRGVSIVLLSDI